MKESDYNRIARAYANSRIFSNTDSVDESAMLDVFVFESELLLCAVSILATLSSHKSDEVPFAHLDHLQLLDKATVRQISDFCELFGQIKRSQLDSIKDSQCR